MFDLLNIFEVFLPQLLRYPNASDPLNGDASSLLLREPKKYEKKVQEYVQRFASASALDDQNEEEDDDDEMSSVGSFSDDEEPAGKLEVWQDFD